MKKYDERWISISFWKFYFRFIIGGDKIDAEDLIPHIRLKRYNTPWIHTVLKMSWWRIDFEWYFRWHNIFAIRILKFLKFRYHK